MTEKHFRILAPLAIFLAAGVAYVNTLDGDWVWDDASSVLLNEHVQQPGYFFQLFREDQHPFGKGAGNFYRPLVAASFMLDFVLAFDSEQDQPLAPHRPADVKPLVFHQTNLLWHAAAAVLLFFLLLRLDAPRWVAVAAPLLFVTHPLHTEAVAYISGRADMMSAAFMFAGLGLALSNARATRRRIDWGAGSLCFVAALLSKESSMIFPVLLALLIFLRPRPQPLAEPVKTYYLREATPLFAAAAILVVYALLRSTVLHFGEPAEQTALPFGTRLLQTGQAFAFYLQKLFLPTRLHMEQTLAGVPTWTSAVGWAGLLLILAGLAGAWRAEHHRIAMGLAWFLAAWLPISGIFPLNAPMAEHWMYVPMAGFWWALCEALWLLARRPARRSALSTAVVVLALAFLGLTVHRNQAWHSNESLFTATLKENPDSLRVSHNLAVTYENLLGNWAGARREFEQVLAQYQAQKRATSLSGDIDYLLDDEIDVRLSLGHLYLQLGDYAKAAEQFGVLARRVAPEKDRAVATEAAMGLGRSLLALGDVAGAGSAFERAAGIEPKLGTEIRMLMLEGAPPAGVS